MQTLRWVNLSFTRLIFYWAYLLPGILLTYLLFRKIEFLERYSLGIILAFAMIGILSYDLALILNWNIKSHHTLLPLSVIVVEAFVLWFWRGKSETKIEKQE